MTTVNNFYNDNSTTNSFGYQLSQALKENFDEYSCIQSVEPSSLPNNCSAEFLSYAQWGGSAITLNPPFTK